MRLLTSLAAAATALRRCRAWPAAAAALATRPRPRRETAAKAAWSDKVGRLPALPVAWTSVAAGYRAHAARQGTRRRRPHADAACSRPGPFAYASRPPASKPLEASGRAFAARHGDQPRRATRRPGGGDDAGSRRKQ